MNRLPPDNSPLPACPGVITKSHTVVAAAAQSSHIPFIKREGEDEDDDDRPDDGQRRLHQHHHHAGTPGGRTSSFSFLSAAVNSTHSTTTTNTNTAAASPEDGPGGKYGTGGMSGGEMGGGETDFLQEEKPIRRKRRVKGQKICGVCGDLAQSHNFGALSCETCKAFFRRNALKQKELITCVFNSSCTITKETRRFCAPCRLKKCYAVGMDSDLILDEDEKRARKIRRSERYSSSANSKMASCDGEPLSVKQEPKVQKQQQQHQVGDQQVTTSYPSASTTPTDCFSPSDLTSTSQGASSVGSDSLDSESVGCTSQYNYPNKGKWCRPRNAQGRGFWHVAREDLPSDMTLFWPLRTDERALLTSLTSAYQSITATISADDEERLRGWSSFCMEKSIFALEISIRQYVQFARHVPEFLHMGQSDQIVMLKCSALQWYHIRLASDFIPDRRMWINYAGAVSQSQLSEFFGDVHGVREYAEFCEGLKFVVKNDTTLYALLHVLVLFDPRDAHLENRTFVNTIRDRYLLLTKHHLESQFSYLHADRYLAEIVEQIMDLRQLSESSLDFYKYFSSQFRPLIAEVLSSD